MVSWRLERDGDLQLGADAIGAADQHRLLVARAERHQAAEVAEIAEDARAVRAVASAPRSNGRALIRSTARSPAAMSTPARASGRRWPVSWFTSAPGANLSCPTSIGIGYRPWKQALQSVDLGQADRLDQPIEAQIAERVGADVLADLVDASALAAIRLSIGRGVDAEVAGRSASAATRSACGSRARRRGAACCHDARRRGAAHDAVVDEDDALARAGLRAAG